MDNNEYVTKDLGETTALLTNGCFMTAIEWKDDVAYFRFQDNQKCKLISQNYFFEGLTGNLRLFYENLRMVKRKLYAESNKRDFRAKK